MHLIVGLGNPGNKYQNTRHNIGFMAIDALNYAFQGGPFKSEHKSLVSKIRIDSVPLIIAKPQTYMNLSGEAVRSLMDYYDISTEHLLVVHDEVDLPFRSFRFQFDRGHGGNNGVRDIHQKLGTSQYARLKVGVSRPSNPRQDVADWVLQNFSQTEEKDLPEILNVLVDGVECFVKNDWQTAANNFNNYFEREE